MTQNSLPIWNLNKTDLFKSITDKSKPVPMDLIKNLILSWKLDILDKSNEGLLKPNLDLSSLFYFIGNKGIRIKITGFSYLRFKSKKSEEFVPLKEKEFIGTLIRVNPSTKTWSFNLVLKTESGEDKTYQLIDNSGSWDPNLRSIEILDLDKITELCHKHSIQLDIKNLNVLDWVNNSKAKDFVSERYLLSKLLITRLSEESNDIYNYLKTAGFFPLKPKIFYPRQYSKNITRFLIKTLEIHVTCTESKSFYPIRLGSDNKALSELRLYYIYELSSRLRFHCRCIEYAYFKQLFKGINPLPKEFHHLQWEKKSEKGSTLTLPICEHNIYISTFESSQLCHIPTYLLNNSDNA